MKKIPNLNSARPALIKRAFRWLFSPRIMRRILIVIAALATLIAVFYARANYRGTRLWEDAKREMAANGETWDWASYVPPPVPDDQNIFKAPKMAEWFGDDRAIMDAPLEHRRTNDFALRFSNTNSTEEITNTLAATAYVAWSDQFQPDFDTIRAALKRPEARIAGDYSKPGSITLPNVASLYAVVKTLTQRAKCQLILGQPDAAWRELTLLRDLRRLVEGQGNFLLTEGDWMRRELARYSLQVIAKGTELHAWQDAQLVALQQQLKDDDFLALHAEALKCGGALVMSSLLDLEFMKTTFSSGGDGFWDTIKNHPEFLHFMFMPRGVLYEKAAKLGKGRVSMVGALTANDGVARPAELTQAFTTWKRAQQGLPQLLRIQSLVNEGQIACALERYRIAQNGYPETLATLVPQFIAKLPNDLINGKPLIYRRSDDGNYLLYSVGWNETDDGGKVVMAKELQVNATEGDWVWKSYMY